MARTRASRVATNRARVRRPSARSAAAHVTRGASTTPAGLVSAAASAAALARKGQPMTEREAAARDFAEAMGWKYHDLPPNAGLRPPYFETKPGTHTGGNLIVFP